MFFRVKETYDRSPSDPSEGFRLHFGFHYGPNTGKTVDGLPKTANNRHTVIRIDEDPTGPHLCYSGENHIKQERVRDFVIADADLFDFVDAVLTHRKYGRSFQDYYMFEIDAAAKK